MEITGRVVQVIPPEAHKQYVFGRYYQNLYKGKNIVVIEALDAPTDSSTLKRIIKRWIYRIKNRKWPSYWDVVTTQIFKENEIVSVNLKPFEPLVTTWEC